MEEDLPRPLREAEGAVLRLGAEVPRPLQGLQVLADLIRRLPLQQAIGGQAVQPQGEHPPVPAASKDLGEQAHPHVIPQLPVDPLDAGEDDLSLAGDVLGDKLPPAVAAVAAGGGMGLAKVVQQLSPEAGLGLAVGHHVLQPQLIPVLDLGRLLWGEGLVILPRLLEEELGRGHIPLAIEEDALRRLPIPAGPAGLLVVGLQALGHVVVDDKTHVGLVDAHAEGVGGHHHRFAVVLKVVLVLPPLRL